MNPPSHRLRHAPRPRNTRGLGARATSPAPFPGPGVPRAAAFPRWARRVVLACWLTTSCLHAVGADSPEPPRYEQREPSLDGTGRFYLGREIARVMGHQGAPWLERSERMEEERPDLLHALLDLQPGMTVADIGAGTGYHSWRMAAKVGRDGRVFAVDIQPEMLELLAANMARRGVTNVVGVLGTPTDPKLDAGSIDLALMVDVYHEFDQPYEMLRAIVEALRPGGRIALVEFRGEQASVPIKPLHKMTEAQVRKEAEVHGLEWIETRRELPWQHLILFRKPATQREGPSTR